MSTLKSRITVDLPIDLLQRLNDASLERRVSRNRLVADALESYLGPSSEHGTDVPGIVEPVFLVTTPADELDGSRPPVPGAADTPAAADHAAYVAHHAGGRTLAYRRREDAERLAAASGSTIHEAFMLQGLDPDGLDRDQVARWQPVSFPDGLVAVIWPHHRRHVLQVMLELLPAR